MIKDRTNATIQPLSKSQLLPDGWSPQEVDTYFNGLNEHQMQVFNAIKQMTCHTILQVYSYDVREPQVAALSTAIGTKSPQQVSDYTQYVCEVRLPSPNPHPYPDHEIFAAHWLNTALNLNPNPKILNIQSIIRSWIDA
jgi:hypothetical protein